jgi:GT2 family glycosyltransferase/predicted O-methyltransferase YrrM
MTRISVIIPVYNGARYLAECIASVQAQTLSPYEIILIDDASTDDTPAIIAGLAAQDARIRTARQPERGGAGAARNRGLEMCEGNIITFLDADDLWTPNKLALQTEILISHNHLGSAIMFGRMQRFISPDVPPDVRARLEDDPEPVDGYVPGTLLANRSVFAQVGNFDASLPTGEFIDWLMRARRMSIMEGIVEEVVLHRRIHDANHTQTEAGRQYARLIKRHLDAMRAEAAPPLPEVTPLSAPPLPPLLRDILTHDRVHRADGTPRPLSAHTTGEICHVLSGLAIQNGATQVIEVGLANGISTVALLSALADEPDLTYDVIDPHQDTIWEGIGALNIERAGFGGRCTIHRQPSEVALPMLMTRGRKYNFAYIDGFHTFDHALLDFFYVNRMLDIGGMVVIDDAYMRAITRLARYISRYPAYQPVPIPTHVRVGETITPTDAHKRIVAFRKIANDERPWDWYADF